MRPFAACTAACLLLAPVVVHAQNIFPSKKEKKMASLLDQEHVTVATRKFLKSQMKNHGQDMRELVIAVAMLRYDHAAQFAQRIANQPRLDRAAVTGTPDGVDLTPLFFTLQDALKKNATELAESAEKKDQKALTASMGRTLDNCMSCHALFLPQPKADAGVAPDAGK